MVYVERPEESSPNMPEPLRNHVQIYCFIDTDHIGDKVKRSSHTREFWYSEYTHCMVEHEAKYGWEILLWDWVRCSAISMQSDRSITLQITNAWDAIRWWGRCVLRQRKCCGKCTTPRRTLELEAQRNTVSQSTRIRYTGHDACHQGRRN